MKVAKINNYSNVSFRENYSSSVNGYDAGLMVQSKNASVNFARDKYITKQMYSVDANPITSLGYKLYRTFGYFRNSERTESAKKTLNYVA